MSLERQHVARSVASVVALLAIGCGASPMQPSSERAATSESSSVGTAVGAATDGVVASGTGTMTPAELVARGWVCRPSPLTPDIIACSHPNQGFPSETTPVSERPATYVLHVFNTTGTFLGVRTFVREDLYAGQLCESTGEPYRYLDRIGYYDCLRTIGG